MSNAYRPDIDGLRAVAVLLVLVFHFHLTASTTGAGFMGVDVFFVISGFLITGIVRSQTTAGTFSLATFWIRRLRRLAPALFAVLALTLAFGAFRLLPEEFEQLSREVIASQLYFANIYFWRTVSYFGLQADGVYLLHTWSLAVEEQFYLLYPIALLIVLKLAGRRFTPWVLLAGFVVSFATNLVMVELKPEATFYLMPTRAWELLAGALLTWAPTTRRYSGQLGLIGAALIVAAVAFYDPNTSFPGWFALLPVAGAACVIQARDAIVNRALSVAPMVYIGRISYSLYLVHWPVNVFATQELGESYTLAWRAALALFCVALAAALYHSIEQPFRQDVLRRRFVTAYAMGLLASVGLCLLIVRSGGAPSRLPEHVTALSAFGKDQEDQRCLYEEGAEFCTLGAAVEPQWLVFGDSHAWAAQAAIDEWLQSTGQAARFAFVNSCLPLQGVDVFSAPRSCRPMNDAAAVLLAEPTITKVFLVSSWRQPAEGLVTDDPGRWLGLEASLELFERHFTSTVAEIHALGKEVYVWEPVPGAKDHVPRALAFAAWRNETADLDLTVSEYRQSTAFFFSALAHSHADGSFSPSAVLCRHTCASSIDGQPVYWDNSHIARSMSGFWANALETQLQR